MKQETGLNPETIPFKTYSGGVIAIKARVGNNPQPLNFILDTGSAGISLDSATCSERGITVKKTDTTVSGIAGRKKVPFVFDVPLTTGNLVTEHMNFYVNDYSLLSSTFGEKIDGIIGYGFLSMYVVNINFDLGRIKIYPKHKFKYRRGGTVLYPNFRKLASHSITVTDKKSAPFDFYLDTGAGLCLLMTERFIKDSSVLLPGRKPVITQAEGLGGKKSMRLTIVKSVKVGPYKFNMVPVYLYDDEENIMSYPLTAGLLGNDILRRFNITLNYPEKEIHIIPNSHFRDDFDYAYTGMSLYYLNDKIIVDDIVPRSPADVAGLNNGDELISVGNTVYGSIQEYKNQLQKAKESINIIITREGKNILLSLNPLSILQ